MNLAQAKAGVKGKGGARAMRELNAMIGTVLLLTFAASATAQETPDVQITPELSIFNKRAPQQLPLQWGCGQTRGLLGSQEPEALPVPSNWSNSLVPMNRNQ